MSVSRTATMIEPTPSSGHWEWNNETNTLEFSGNHGSDKQDKMRNRKANKAGVHFQDLGVSKQSNRDATPSVKGSKGVSLNRPHQSRLNAPKSPRQSKGQEHKNVTLEDVKEVAIGRLAEIDYNIHPSFEGIYMTSQFDEFLMYLLNYFRWFYEKRAHEQKPNPMNIEPSMAELKYYSDLCVRIKQAQKLLGQSYCVLVLGVGLEMHHHMACGLSRVSSTYKDREMFETLYTFLTFVVWITFRRPEYDVIQKELGRLLRSDTFNPAIRVKNALEKETEGDFIKMTKEATVKPLLSAAEYRRIHGKRPAIRSIINQRSPALVSILPSPKEEASWLFQKHETLQNQKAQASAKQDDMVYNSETFKCGIIGEPLSQFNPNTLTPLGTDNEEEIDAEIEKVRRESLQVTQGKLPSDMSRHGTGLSQVPSEREVE